MHILSLTVLYASTRSRYSNVVNGKGLVSYVQAYLHGRPEAKYKEATRVQVGRDPPLRNNHCPLARQHAVRCETCRTHVFWYGARAVPPLFLC